MFGSRMPSRVAGVGRWPGLAFGLFLLGLLAAPLSALAAGTVVPVTTASGEGTGGATIVVLPEGMSPAERDAIIAQVVHGGGQAAAAGSAGDDESWDQVTKDLEAVKGVLVESLINIPEIPAVLTTILRQLTPEGGARWRPAGGSCRAGRHLPRRGGGGAGLAATGLAPGAHRPHDDAGR